MPDTAEPRPGELPLRSSCGSDGVGVSQRNAAINMPAIRLWLWVAPTAAAPPVQQLKGCSFLCAPETGSAK